MIVGSPEPVPATVPPAPRPKGPRRSSGTLRRYLIACAMFVAALLVGVMVNGSAIGSIGYPLILFAVCVWPAFLGRANARYRLLSVFMGCYFVIFGLAASVAVVTGESTRAFSLGQSVANSMLEGLLLKSDAVVIIGALCFLGAYFLVDSAGRQRHSAFLTGEWRYGTVLWLGVVTWAIGFGVSVVYDTVVSPLFIPTHVLGLPIGIASNLRLLSPLGAAMLIYLVTRQYRTALVWILLGAIIATEFVMGFLSNSKEISFRVLVLLLSALYYTNGRVSTKLLVMMVVVSVPYLLFFNTYRQFLMESGYVNPAGALEAFQKNAETVKNRAERKTDATESGLKHLVQRIDGKVYVDIIVVGTDTGRVPLMYGESLGWFFSSFIPRFLWAGKPDISIGQVFNWAFQLSESRFTFVPTTQLGELYWNFGLFGVIAGMGVIGAVFGWLSRVLSSGFMTLPRFLVLLVATYYLAIRFEGNIATQYSTVVRVIILIWVVDVLLRQFGVSRRIRLAARPSPAARTETG